MKLSKWFRPEVKPVRSGVYLTSIDPNLLDWNGYCHWDGRYWSIAYPSVVAAYRLRRNISFEQRRSWRGILKDEA